MDAMNDPPAAAGPLDAQEEDPLANNPQDQPQQPQGVISDVESAAPAAAPPGAPQNETYTATATASEQQQHSHYETQIMHNPQPIQEQQHQAVDFGPFGPHALPPQPLALAGPPQFLPSPPNFADAMPYAAHTHAQGGGAHPPSLMAIQFYEAQMRDHAVAYATAAAGAALAAAQLAQQAGGGGNVVASTNGGCPPMAPWNAHGGNHSFPQQGGPPGPPNPFVAWPPYPHAPPPNGAGPPPPHYHWYPGPPFRAPPPPHPHPGMPHQPCIPHFHPQAMHFEQPIEPVFMEQQVEEDARDMEQDDDGNNHATNANHNDSDDDDEADYGRARKRTQLSSENASDTTDGIPSVVVAAAPAVQHDVDSARPSARRRPSYAASASAGPFSHASGARGKIRRRMRSDGDNSSSSGSSFFNYTQPSYTRGNGGGRRHSGGSYHTKKKKARSDASLVGKTAVAALYEWCSRRQLQHPVLAPWQPALQQQGQQQQQPANLDEDAPSSVTTNHLEVFFDFAVWINHDCVGRGRGISKVAAKQSAARRALQHLVPGVVFDEATGILVSLPPSAAAASENANTATSAVAVDPTSQLDAAAAANDNETTKCEAEELAPNLAKRLAIGRDGQKRFKASQEQRYSRQQHQPQTKRPLGSYPGTSTTSEDEDENTFYASRVNFVCSNLLHTMAQIDPRIPDAPVFTYSVDSASVLPSSGGEGGSSLKRKVSTAANPLHPHPQQASAISVPRGPSTCKGPFACTGQLRIIPTEETDGTTSASNEEAKQSLDEDSSKVSADAIISQKNRCSPRGSQVLNVVGVASTKREARHIASAKLLSLLFPECDTMLEVKAAAEAARERYAASRDAEQRQRWQQRYARRLLQQESYFPDQGDGPPAYLREDLLSSLGACASSSDPPLPSHIAENVRHVLEGRRSCDVACAKGNVRPVQSDSEAHPQPESMLLRQLSRQKQMDAQVELALQCLNDRDEEGRSLPEELTDNDVGRTVLRRAEPVDLPRILKLFSGNEPSQEEASPSLGPLSVLMDDCDDANSKETQSVATARRFWSSSSIILLLCRAISPHEDPPLGCAVLTLGFSVENQGGRSLRVAQLANEPHLPRERLLECLESFAKYMKCRLESLNSSLDKFPSLRETELCSILESYVASQVKGSERTQPSLSTNIDNEAGNSEFVAGEARVSSPLQAVREESEYSDEASGDEKRHAGVKRTSKPSKRTRVE